MSAVPEVAYYALLEIFVFLAVAELLHSFARKVGVPTLVSDLLLGVLLSSFALGGVLNSLIGVPIFVVNDYILLFADFSVILLLFAAGLGGGFAGLRRAGPPAVLAAVAGDLVPFALALVVFSRFYSVNVALLLAVACAATSSAVVASLLQSERLTDTPVGQFHMNVAALDDVVALVLLSVVLTIVGGQFDVIAVTGSIVELAVAWVVLLLASVLIIPRLLRVPQLRDAQRMPFLFLFVLVAVVVALGFSAVIGAFIAGLAVAESLAASRTRQITEILLILFGSLFFVVVGAQFDVHELLVPGLIVFALLLALIAAAGKVVAVYPFARLRWTPAQARAISVGMIPRGEIGLIIGAIGYADGILTQTTLGVVLVMSIVTTLAGSLLFRRADRAIRPAAPLPPTRPPEVVPSGPSAPG